MSQELGVPGAPQFVFNSAMVSHAPPAALLWDDRGKGARCGQTIDSACDQR
ncbi:hypothetical protein CGRA01v4_06901 [Colletotrichum graminicola]|nr:hypothetical protein CGRA01v4_06901 [Colletotrichum graminicola]